jgi:sorbose reductase
LWSQEGTGIGYALSYAVAKAGANVAIVYRSAKDADNIASEIAQEYNIIAKAFQCDVSDGDRVSGS